MISIFYTQFDRPFNAGYFNWLKEKMPSEIKSKICRFKQWKDAHAYLLGKCLLLHALSAVELDYSLDDLKYDQHLRPFFSSDVDFNISHSGSLVVCALSRQGRIGIDIEQKKALNISDFKDQFSQAEWESITNDEFPHNRFYDYWTIKESVLKADGRGMWFPFAQVNIVAQDRITLVSEPWYYNKLNILKEYSCHIAYKIKQDYVLEQINFM